LLTDVLDEHRQLIHADNTLLFKVFITIHSHVDFSAQPLTKMIENASSENEILAFARDDLSKVIVDIKGKKAGDDIRKQDILFASRFNVKTDVPQNKK
jgi:hypothetical protein